MAEALPTYEQSPPFALNAIITPEQKVKALGIAPLERVVIEASLEVSAAAVAALDTAAEEGAEPTAPAFNSVHEMGTELGKDVHDDELVRDALLAATPTEARRLGAFAASTVVSYWITAMGQRRDETVEVDVREAANLLRRNQSAYEPGSRAQVRGEANEVLESPWGSNRQADELVRELDAEAANMPPNEAAQQAQEYLAQVPLNKFYTDVVHTTLVGNTSPSAVEALLAEAPELVAKVVAAVETSSDVEKSQSEQYRYGIRRAVAYISLVTSMTASGEQGGAASA